MITSFERSVLFDGHAEHNANDQADCSVNKDTKKAHDNEGANVEPLFLLPVGDKWLKRGLTKIVRGI